MDIRAHNRRAWNQEVARGNRWTVSVGPAAVAAARRGEFAILLTPTRPVPRDWFGELAGRDVLCLASGGGQQGPLLAAAGARVTVLDNSPAQLERDRQVAEREGLDLRLVEGDMRDLAPFADGSFDLAVHPVSNVFVPDVRPVWREAFRVLRPGGALLAGMTSPLRYLFDWEEVDRHGVLEVRYAVPYSDLTSPPPAVRQRRIASGEPLEFGHGLDDLIGGQLVAGFVLAGFYEDVDAPEANDPLSRFAPSFFATRAVRPATSRFAKSQQHRTGVA